VTSGSIAREVPSASRARAGVAVRSGFGSAVRAEWVKFRSVRGWLIGMVVAGLLVVFVGVFLAANGTIGCQNGPNSPNLTGKACLPPVPIGPGGEAVTDSFYFARQPLTGNGSITIRVTSLTGTYSQGLAQAGQGPPPTYKGLDAWAKAGIIIKASTKPGSAYAAMMVTGSHGVRMQYDYTSDVAGLPGPVSSTSPRWLRLTRSGDMITGYDSGDGTHWHLVGTARLADLAQRVQAGMFAATPPYHKASTFFLGSSSTGGPALATASFDDASLRGIWPAKAWTGGTIGASKLAPDTGRGSFRHGRNSYVVSGSGDIAPLTLDTRTSVPTATVAGPLAGVFVGLIAVIVVAAMFFTTEYRRGLIRVTLAATPQRGRVLAAKAIVVGLVAFVVGLAASVLAVWLGLPKERALGLYVLPVSTLTEVRVIVGTAALVGVAAILALAIGAILRRSAAAVTTVIVAIVLPYLLSVTVLPLSVADWVLRLTPAAGLAIQQSIPHYPQVSSGASAQSGMYPLTPWAGFAVLCLYAAVALVLAAVLLRRRDA
jgi:ABC-type transport system involved in multi-copper enzyme maturation permease subunit